MSTPDAIYANFPLRPTGRVEPGAFVFNDMHSAEPSLPPTPAPEVTTSCHLSPDISIHQPGEPGLCHEHKGSFTLYQSYPEPDTGETSISFILPINSDIQLDVFDPLGRKVMGLVRKELKRGEQIIRLNLRGLGLPAGVYSYQVRVANRYGVYHQRKLTTAK
ncbi:T9SS type A sorting domain-containing protein [Hymenobacter sp. BT664]|uniref:T9SS type A sorting domain-containing protein n=1 Tax=Hymenobacter montanus TaxID=2771359 RepID=A0A927BCH8_9BACT|nr:T9SS type A sorting domain-containing protein [Hymenobacter montanus]MBD2767458.1 T9SS type A sorting domain-containing protein [Hymenobacter montanus]